MKYIITESKLRRVQFKFLDYLFEDMYEVIAPSYKTIFLKKDNQIVFALRKAYENKLEVSYTFWKDIEDMFSLDYGATQDLMEEWAEQRLGFGKVRVEAVDFW
jgi:hypothetical protein